MSNDSIEIFLDKNVAAAEASVENVKHYVIYPRNAASSNIKYYTSTTADCYIIQTAIPIDDIKPAQGKMLGIDFRVNDDKGDGKVSSVVVWNDEKNKLDTDTAGFGDVVLDKESKLIVVDYGAPVVDGIIDSEWNSVKENTTGVWVSGTSGSTANFKTLRDDNNLYLLAVVKDELLSKASSNAYEQDSVEIFIDEDNAKNSYYEADDYQIRINYANEVTYDHGVKIEGLTSATAIIDGGYIVEVAIPLTSVKPEEGRIIGFDLQVNNDQDGDGVRDSVSMWCDPSGSSYKTCRVLEIFCLARKKKSKDFSYIAPDFLRANSSASKVKSGFKVEIAGTSKSAVTDSNGYFDISAWILQRKSML
jgi:endo-1,4-beta-xylanase